MRQFLSMIFASVLGALGGAVLAVMLAPFAVLILAALALVVTLVLALLPLGFFILAVIVTDEDSDDTALTAEGKD